MLRPEEVEMLVCGNPDFDMKALSKVTTYDGFSRRDVTIRCCIVILPIISKLDQTWNNFIWFITVLFVTTH